LPDKNKEAKLKLIADKRRHRYMVAEVKTPAKPEIIYPDSDGEPMADNPEHFQLIVLIKDNLELWFSDDPNVFVAGDLFLNHRHGFFL